MDEEIYDFEEYDEAYEEWLEEKKYQSSTTPCGCRFFDCSECGSREMCV